MMERNGPGEIKTERRSPIMASGVATPKEASNNIATAIAMPAIRPASRPAKIAFDRLIIIVDLTIRSKCWNQIMLAEQRCCGARRGERRNYKIRRLTQTPLQLLERNAHKRGENSSSGHKCAAQGAGNF